MTYNATQARYVPRTLDVYINGRYPNGFVTPSFQLERTDYPEEATSSYYTFNATVSVSGFEAVRLDTYLRSNDPAPRYLSRRHRRIRR